MWKVLPVLGAIVGIIGFFLPFVEVRPPNGGWPVTVSAFDIVSGDLSIAALQASLPEGAAASADVREALQRFSDLSKDYGAAMLVLYIPAALQLLISAVGLFGRFGRTKGVFAVVLGLASIAVAYAFWSARPDPATGVKLGWGVIAIAVAGIGGVIGGVIALVRPERD
jgi:hypothetical protein